MSKTKTKPSYDSLCFFTPEQKVLRYLVTNASGAFQLRALSTKLKGVRGLGGAVGLMKILKIFEEQGIVRLIDHDRGVRLQEDHPAVRPVKILSAICDLEDLREQLSAISQKGILFGSRSTGRCRPDSDYDIFVVTESSDEVIRVAQQHPMGKMIEIIAWSQDDYLDIDRKDTALAAKLLRGLELWG